MRFPTTFIIDRAGIIRDRKVGSGADRGLREADPRDFGEEVSGRLEEFCRGVSDGRTVGRCIFRFIC